LTIHFRLRLVALILVSAMALAAWPGAASAASSTAAGATPAGTAPAYVSYTVRPGDSLWSLSRASGTTVAALQGLNGLGGTVIYAGQTLRLPVRTYTVRSGDTLWAIARRFGLTVGSLMSCNGLASTTIHPGQRLVVRGAGLGAGGALPASRDGAALSSSDLDLLARLVRAESEAEPYAGQVAVAAVVLNRMRSSRFPDTVREVIYEPHQFETATNGRLGLTATETQRRAVLDALGGWDASGGALFFYNPAGTQNTFLRSLTVTARIGGHIFCR
jgi:N-acetylmuramoyl-L-alanine amidase